MLQLKDGASYERVSDARTTRNVQGADVTSNAGDVILTGPGGEVATIPSSVFDAVFVEVADVPNAPDGGSSPTPPDAASAPPSTQS